jgi:hypothetical protein
MKIATLLLAISIAPSASASLLHGSVGCAPTAEAAVAHLLTNSAGTDGSNGFRIDTIRVDAVQNKRWAVVVSCADPSRPHRAILLPQLANVSARLAEQSIAVHTGDAVTVISRGQDSAMTLHGTAVEAGFVGRAIRVRLQLALGDSPDTDVSAVVVQPGVVEVKR